VSAISARSASTVPLVILRMRSFKMPLYKDVRPDVGGVYIQVYTTSCTLYLDWV
jgi:hypothetical protein